MEKCAATDATIRVVVHIGILTKRIAMVDSIADTTIAITILMRDRAVCLTNKPNDNRHSRTMNKAVPVCSNKTQED